MYTRLRSLTAREWAFYQPICTGWYPGTRQADWCIAACVKGGEIIVLRSAALPHVIKETVS